MTSQAAVKTTTSTWRIVLARRFGAATAESGFDAVIAHKKDAWFFGGTNFAGPGHPLIEHRLDGHWHTALLPGQLPSWITAASAVSPKSVWAVGYLGGYVLTWNQLGWTRVASGGWAPGTQFTGIDAITKHNVWVFGSGGRHRGAGTWHLTGTTWGKVGGIAGDIYSASDLSATSIWAIGGIKGTQNAVEYYDGAKWRHVTARALSGLRFSFVLAQAPDDVWLAGSIRQKGKNHPKLVHWNGKHWVRIAVPGAVTPTGITSDGSGGIWVVANQRSGPPYLLRRSGSGKWRLVKIGSSSATRISAVAIIPGSDSVWGAGFSPAKTGRKAAIYLTGTTGLAARPS